MSENLDPRNCLARTTHEQNGSSKHPKRRVESGLLANPSAVRDHGQPLQEIKLNHFPSQTALCPEHAAEKSYHDGIHRDSALAFSIYDDEGSGYESDGEEGSLTFRPTPKTKPATAPVTPIPIKANKRSAANYVPHKNDNDSGNESAGEDLLNSSTFNPILMDRDPGARRWPRDQDLALFSIVNGDSPYKVRAGSSPERMWDDVHSAFKSEFPDTKKTKLELRKYWLSQGGRDQELNADEYKLFKAATEVTEEEEGVRLIIYRFHQLTRRWLALPAARRLFEDMKQHDEKLRNLEQGAETPASPIDIQARKHMLSGHRRDSIGAIPEVEGGGEYGVDYDIEDDVVVTKKARFDFD